MKGTVRHREKRDILCLYLVQFEMTTQSIFCRYLGLNPHGQGRFFAQLVEQRWLHKLMLPVVAAPLYIPTMQLRNYADELTAESTKMNTLPSRVRLSTVRHCLYIQEALIEEGGLQAGEFIADHLLGDMHSKRPDLLLNGSHAIEVELSHKNTQRVYLSFSRLAVGLSKNTFEQVTYYAHSATLLDDLRNKFAETEWPVVRYSPESRAYVTLKDQMATVRSDVRKSFDFKLLEVTI